ncbi:MAG: GGDEF domain-containing protein [Phyllobacteriaceae bacterium]|nr:GGDEF domain-containing protein [Phyllobacteriaceae bacterium]
MGKANSVSGAPDIESVEPLAPIRRLVVAALCCALLGIITLVASAIHVMETTDADAMARERQRANAIADQIAGDPGEGIAAQLKNLGAIAGLADLQIVEARPSDEGRQAIPLFSGEYRGKFLSWIPAQLGRMLFDRFAPSRVPVMAAMIVGLLACLLLMRGHVRKIEAARRRARHQARRDHLTGLANRLALEEELQRLHANEQPFSLLVFDLDNFKPINDELGHAAGDKVLQEVAGRLKGRLQPGEFLARVGGDEFVAIVQRYQMRKTLAQLAEDCIAAVSAPLIATDGRINVGVSIGIVADGQATAAGTSLRLADRALYDAKRLKGSTFCFAGDMPVLRLEPGDQVQSGMVRTA